MTRTARYLSAAALGLGALAGCTANGVTVAEDPAAATRPASTPKAKAPTARDQGAAAMACMGDAHVTRIQISGGFLGMAEVFTTYSGGMFGSDAGAGKLLASAFAACASTDDHTGLVSVYDDAGDLLSNGNF